MALAVAVIILISLNIVDRASSLIDVVSVGGHGYNAQVNGRWFVQVPQSNTYVRRGGIAVLYGNSFQPERALQRP